MQSCLLMSNMEMQKHIDEINKILEHNTNKQMIYGKILIGILNNCYKTIDPLTAQEVTLAPSL